MRGELFKTARASHHLKQVEAARLLGVTQQTVSRWENGDRLPSGIHDLVAYATLFDISLDRLFADEIAQFRKEHLIYGNEILETYRDFRQVQKEKYSFDL